MKTRSESLEEAVVLQGPAAWSCMAWPGGERPKGALCFFAWHPEGSNTSATMQCLTCGKQWESPWQEGPVGLVEISISVGRLSEALVPAVPPG